MPNDAKFQINIETVASGTGAQQAKADLSEIAAIQKEQQSLVAQIVGSKTAEVDVDATLTELEKARAAIVSTQLEANQLRAAGQIAEADALEAEVALETRALQLQRVLNVEREEAVLLARQDLAAQEQIAAALAIQNESGMLSGMNLGKARSEATVLARELATGGNYMRTFGALAGSLGPMLGVASVAGFVLYEVVKKHYEEERKIREEQEKITAEIGNTERAYADSVIEARKLKEPTAEWAKALKEANEAIDSSTESYKKMIEQQNQVLESQKELDLAKIESQDISPEEKEKKKFDVEVRYAAHRKENADKIYDAEIAREKQKITNQETAAKAAAEAAGAAQAKETEAVKAGDALQEQKQRANYRLTGSGTGNEKDEVEHELMKSKAWKDQQANPTGPGQTAVDELKKRIESERAGLRNWIQSDQLKEDEQSKKAAIDKANEETKQALTKQQAAQEAAAAAEMTGNQKIINLEGDKATASTVYKNKNQAATYREKERIRKDQEQAAKKEEQEEKKANKAAQKNQKEDDKEWNGFMAGPQGGAATQEVIDLAKSVMGSRPTQEGVGRNTYDKITAELKALSAHGNNEKDLAELIKSMSDFAKTAAGKIAAQNQQFTEHAAKIRQLEARIRGNSPGAS